VPPPAVTTESPQPQGVNRRLLLAAAAGSALAVAGGTFFFKSLPQAPSSTGPQAAIPPVEAFFPTLIIEQDGSAQADSTDILYRTREAISRFDDLVLVEESSMSDMASTAQASRRHGWSLTLRLGIRSAGPDEMRIAARLLDRADQRLIWSREFDPMPLGPSGDVARSAVIRSIATTIAQPYGVIHAHVRKHFVNTLQGKDPYRCIVDSLDYWNANDVKTHGETRACLFERLADYPAFGPLYAQLAYLHLEEYRQGYNPLPGNALSRAVESARTAVKLSPTSARAHQSLMAAYYAAADMQSAWRAADDALRLNPYDTEIIADIGAYHVLAGNFENGLGYLTQAMQLNPAPPVWVGTFRAIALYMLGRIEESGPMVRGLDGANYAPALIALVMSSFQFRDAGAGKRHLERLRSTHPQVVANLPAFLRKLGFQEKAAERVVFDFERAVSWISDQ
jgi:tetratricopeptide (TPR) repeat protein